MYDKYTALRDKKGVTDYRVSEETGITKSTFTDWKKGRSKPKFDKLMALARYFNVPVDHFADENSQDT
jgi:repressor LexA